eukprot:TRINITY_DN867_c2_g1_i6.p3 TRINITY_DN867_c2_g1~~TRINITY_DN867_c2_g1_i6.p3  ORF type:complete len:117 (-),score=0.58 TRINITY_DN867_c2_g1_i6:246-596(-)
MLETFIQIKLSVGGLAREYKQTLQAANSIIRKGLPYDKFTLFWLLYITYLIPCNFICLYRKLVYIQEEFSQDWQQSRSKVRMRFFDLDVGQFIRNVDVFIRTETVFAKNGWLGWYS